MMRRAHRFAIALSVVVLATLRAPAAHAQQAYTLTLSPGTELRLLPRATHQRIRGRLVVLAGDTLLLKEDEGTVRYSLSGLQSLEVRGGEDKRRGVMIGAGIATAITGVFGGIDVSRGAISGEDLLGTLLGNAFIGGLVGYAFAPRGWERLPLPTP